MYKAQIFRHVTFYLQTHNKNTNYFFKKKDLICTIILLLCIYKQEFPIFIISMDYNNKKYFQSNQSAVIWVHKLFERYNHGLATDKEKKIIENWNPEINNVIYDISDESVKSNCDAIWLRLSENFDFNGIEKKMVDNAVEKKIQLYRYTKFLVAASLIFFMGLSFYFFNSRDNNSGNQKNLAIVMSFYQSGNGEMKKMILPDGSVIFLNSNTKVALSTKYFNKKKREIWLQEGEAFFEVAKDASKPFIVHTQNIETTVRGTAFNVKAYKELGESSVSVKEGKVEVSNKGSLLGTLTKNKLIIYNKKTKTYKAEIANWEDAAAWMDSRLVMFHTNSDELKLRLKQHFGVEVVLKNNALEGALLNASFKQGAKLNEVADVISVLYKVKYKIVNPKSIIFYK
jgi:transmembrane sensor